MVKKLRYSDDHHNYYSGHKMSTDFGPQEEFVSIVFQNFTHVYYLYIYICQRKKRKKTKTVWSDERKEPTHSERISVHS